MNGKHVSDMDMVGVSNNAYVCIKKNVIYQQQNIVSNLIWERKREKKIIEKGNEEIYIFFGEINTRKRKGNEICRGDENDKEN